MMIAQHVSLISSCSRASHARRLCFKIVMLIFPFFHIDILATIIDIILIFFFFLNEFWDPCKIPTFM